MKKKAILLALLSVLVFVSLAQALPQYTINSEIGPYPGGPFQITGPNGVFDTFCIESQEYLNVGGTYYGTIDSVVYNNSGVSPNTLYDQTKRLYNYFLDHGGSAGFTSGQLGNIQKAIWDYQNQPGWDNTQVGNWYYDKAGTFAMTRTVEVLNLWINSDGTGLAQSQLTMVPEPMSLLLLGLGLIGVAGIRRKFKSSKS